MALRRDAKGWVGFGVLRRRWETRRAAADLVRRREAIFVSYTMVGQIDAGEGKAVQSSTRWSKRSDWTSA